MNHSLLRAVSESDMLGAPFAPRFFQTLTSVGGEAKFTQELLQTQIYPYTFSSMYKIPQNGQILRRLQAHTDHMIKLLPGTVPQQQAQGLNQLCPCSISTSLLQPENAIQESNVHSPIRG